MTADDENRNGPLGGRAGITAVALSPFVALALYILVGSQGGWGWGWLFFLLVPVTAIIVYGPPGRNSRR
jgi:MFS family permease